MIKTLFIILCILAYIVIGICAAMIEIHQEIKDFGEVDKEEKYYIGVGFFWPIWLVILIIYYPFSLLGKFFKWYINKVEKGEDE